MSDLPYPDGPDASIELRIHPERSGPQVWAASLVAVMGGGTITHTAIIFGATSRADAEAYAIMRAKELFPHAQRHLAVVTYAPGARLTSWSGHE